MPTLAVLQAAVDTSITALITAQLTPLQNTFQAGHSARYFQGILTTNLSALPNNRDVDPSPLTMVPDLSRSNTRRPGESWTAFGLVLATSTFGLEMYAYANQRAAGRGYQIGTYIKHVNILYVRYRNVGSESSRDSVWLNLTNILAAGS